MTNKQTYILKLSDLPEDIREFLTHLPSDAPIVLLKEDSQPYRVLVSHDELTATAVLEKTWRYGVGAIDASGR